MTNLEKVVTSDDFMIDGYLEEVTKVQFKADVLELQQAYSDNGVVDRAIELLQSMRTKEVK